MNIELNNPPYDPDDGDDLWRAVVNENDNDSRYKDGYILYKDNMDIWIKPSKNYEHRTL